MVELSPLSRSDSRLRIACSRLYLSAGEFGSAGGLAPAEFKMAVLEISSSSDFSDSIDVS